MTKKVSIKEAGEGLPQDQWERFEAAVDAAVKNGPKRKLTHKVDTNQSTGFDPTIKKMESKLRCRIELGTGKTGEDDGAG